MPYIKISDVINKLKTVQQEKGDIDVKVYWDDESAIHWIASIYVVSDIDTGLGYTAIIRA